MTTSTQLGPIDARGQLTDPGQIRRYILGGNSTFTLWSLARGQRFTYRVKSTTQDRDRNWSTGNQDRSTYFVSVLAGSDNESSYDYIGLLSLTPSGYYAFRQTARSQHKPGSPAWDAFSSCWLTLDVGARWPSRVEFFHEGICCLCGRKLTAPESVANGIGPECATKGE